MYGQTSFDTSKNSNSIAPKGLALLFGLIVIFQVVNHMFLHHAVTQEDDEFESDSGCAAVPGASGYSSLCMEAQLFKGWHELPADSPADLENLLVASPSASSQSSEATTSEAPAVKEASAQPKQAAPRGDAKPDHQDSTAVTKEGKPEEMDSKALESMLWDMAFKMGGGNQSHTAPEKTTHKPSAFMAKKQVQKPKKKGFSVEELEAKQQKLEATMKTQARRHAEHRALRALHQLGRNHSHDSASTDHQTSWAHDLEDLTHDLQAQMDEWHKERAKHAAMHAAVLKKNAVKDDAMTPWAHNLDDMTHEIQDHLEARKKERAEHEALHEAHHAARLRAAKAASHDEAEAKSPFMNEVEALGRELCQDPARHDRPACAQFLHPQNVGSQTAHNHEREEKKSHHDNAMAHIKLLEKHLEGLETDRQHENEDIRRESTQFLKELCADPARHDYPSCAPYLPLLKTEGAGPAPGALRGAPAEKPPTLVTDAPQHHAPQHLASHPQPHALSWAPWNASEVHPQHMGWSPLLMNRQELKMTHWSGKVPKVACVAVLPQGQVTETLMRYFMDNYKLQHYEGSNELVLVYHHADTEAARIAHLFADGTSVKAAAARGGDEFPSATAYRYGAWVAHDADLIVRWDFEAWHHPNRLSMQVRAIALSKRQASLVTRVTAFDAEGRNGTVAGGAGPHGSLMGDAAWMRKHWMPTLEEESAMIHGLHSSNIVQVAMPDLLAYHDASMLGAAAHSWVDVDATM